MAGWFLVHRDIEDHWIWKSNEPFDKRSAWIDLIMLANHHDRKVTSDSGVALRKRGDVDYSMLFLAKRWKWDRRKVKRFLMALQSDGMVSLNGTSDGTTNGTTVTIENYDKYQFVGTTDGTYHSTHDGTYHGTTDGTQNKELKEFKELKDHYYSNREAKLIDTKGNDDDDDHVKNWGGKWTYADPETGRIRFDIEQAKKDRGLL